jgi:hypothetical protein
MLPAKLAYSNPPPVRAVKTTWHSTNLRGLVAKCASLTHKYSERI